MIVIQDIETFNKLIDESFQRNATLLANKFLDLTSKDNTAPLWISRKDYASKHGVSIAMVDKLTRLGKLDTKKIGRRTLIRNN